MNKKEKEIMLKGYERNLISLSEGFEYKKEVVREYSILLDNLGLMKEKYEVENKILADLNDLNEAEKDMYDMIIKDLNKYDIYCNYSDIENYIYELEYEFTEEQLRCNKARINYLNENNKLTLNTF